MKNDLQRHKCSDKVKGILMFIAFVLLFVAVIGLGMELFGTGKTKPSEWFKQEETVEESSDMENNVEHTAGRARAYASTYSTSDESTVAPPCDHLPEIVEGISYVYGANLTL